MIAELQEERKRIDEAIEALERLGAGKTRRRGRPPAWLTGRAEHDSEDSEEESASGSSKNKKS